MITQFSEVIPVNSLFIIFAFQEQEIDPCYTQMRFIYLQTRNLITLFDLLHFRPLTCLLHFLMPDEFLIDLTSSAIQPNTFKTPSLHEHLDSANFLWHLNVFNVLYTVAKSTSIERCRASILEKELDSLQPLIARRCQNFDILQPLPFRICHGLQLLIGWIEPAFIKLYSFIPKIKST